VAALIGMGISIELGFILVSSLLLISIGMPMAIEDFVGNYEGNAADRRSKRSIFPAIHGAYGVGMLLGAVFSSWAINQGIDLPLHYFISALLVAAVSITSGALLPDRRSEKTTEPQAAKGQTRVVWREKRSLLIALVGFLSSWPRCRLAPGFQLL
jgi:hypothetical protein